MFHLSRRRPPRLHEAGQIDPQELVFDVKPETIADAKIREQFGDELFVKKAVG